MALSIYQLPGSNALQTARGVYARMNELKQRFPDGVDYQIVYDTTPFINESITEVFHTLRDAVILVAIVVLVFLQNWRSAIIPLVAVPVAIIGTFAAMAANVPTTATGTATSGMSDDRQFCRKTSTTTATRTTASKSVSKTSRMDSLMNGVVS